MNEDLEVVNKFAEISAAAKELAQKVIEAIETEGYQAGPFREKGGRVQIDSISDESGKQFSINVDIKPWANRSNKRYEPRSGIIMMCGPHNHRRFKRKRFGPNNIQGLVGYIKKFINFNHSQERARLNRSERSQKRREEKYRELANTMAASMSENKTGQVQMTQKQWKMLGELAGWL